MTKRTLPFMKYQTPFILASLLFVAISIYFLATRGLNYGIDFQGGVSLNYRIAESTNSAAVTRALEARGLEGFVVQQFGDASAEATEFLIRIKQESEQQNQALIDSFNQALTQQFGDKAQLKGTTFVGATVGKELRQQGLMAGIWACLIILVYIGIRFDFYFAPGAIVALIHDTLVTLGAFAITGREVNLTVLAAVLTLIGYSVNDTIIIFDRIRENLGLQKRKPLREIIDISISQTIVRSLLTSLTVFFVVAVLFVMAGGDIENFAFAMLIGVIAGTYSSIFIASPVFLFLHKIFSKSPKPQQTAG